MNISDKKRKGVSVIVSLVLVFTIIAATSITVFKFGFPEIEKMRDTSAIKRSIDSLKNLDSVIQRVASEEKHSSRSVSLSLDRGEYYFQNVSDSIIYKINTNSGIVTSHSSRKVGNLKLAADSNVTTNTTSVNGESCYMMENSHLKACIKKAGSPTNYVDINTSDLLVYFYNKDLNRELNASLKIYPLNKESGSSGQGYTELREEGFNIGIGRVTTHLTTDLKYSYKINFDLITDSDFLLMEVKSDL